METIYLSDSQDVPANFTGTVIFQDGFVERYKDGKFHCEDGPAKEFPSGTREWYWDGKVHRFDGPAVILPEGDEEWWLFGDHYQKHHFDMFVGLTNQALAENPNISLPEAYEQAINNYYKNYRI